MSKNKVLLTEEGLQKLKDKVKSLVKEFMEVSATKGEAAEIGGDAWHDNPAFEDVEHRQTMIQKQIADLSEELENAEVIEDKNKDDKIVSIGSVVELELEDGKVVKFKITGHAQTDPSKGLISYQSPLGACLLDKELGSVCEYRVNSKIMKVIIKNILKE